MNQKRPDERTMLETTMRVLKYLSRPRSRYDVAELLGCSPRTALRLMQAMRDVGLVDSFLQDRVTQYVALQAFTRVKRAKRTAKLAA